MRESEVLLQAMHRLVHGYFVVDRWTNYSDFETVTERAGVRVVYLSRREYARMLDEHYGESLRGVTPFVSFEVRRLDDE